MNSSARRALLASGLVYFGLTLIMGQRVLAALGSGIASDAGDPVLVAAILAWNAGHAPWTDAWWDFPSFYPTAATLTFSEHLLGISVLASPVQWLTGNPLATYNITLLLTYPLSGLAMYALAWRLTRHAGAAFLAGLAFAFAPYRVSHLPHLQVLAMFWAPLAMLGLHAYLETGRRRWLVLFGASWGLQGAANGYMLVFLSVLAIFWVLWFVAAHRRWRDAAMIAAAMLLAALPLLPILYRYLTVHAQHGFFRSFGEVAFFGADIAALLCAPAQLTFWGWLDVACGPEGELFAGAGLIALCCVAAVMTRRSRATMSGPDGRAVRTTRQLVMLAAVVYVGIAASVVVSNPWTIEFGPLRASASSPVKPLSAALGLLLVAGVLSPRLRAAVRRSSIPAFYLLAAVGAWVLAWGPSPALFGEEVLYMAPYRWLMQVPGVDGLRVPARFWMISVMCLAVLMAVLVAEWLKGRRPSVAFAVIGLGASALIVDGWATIPIAAGPDSAPNPAALRGGVALELPLGDAYEDAPAQFRAVTGGWTAVNGFSGYEPAHYHALRVAMAAGDPVLFGPFVERGDLHVLVAAGASGLQALVQRLPGVEVTGRNTAFVQYRLPRQGTFGSAPRLGERIPIQSVRASCEAGSLSYAMDGDRRTRWSCGPQTRDEDVTVDLGGTVTVGAVIHGLGSFAAEFPRWLVVETSVDGLSWSRAWEGRPLAAVIEASMADPRAVRAIIELEPQPARYVRLAQRGRDELFDWSIAHLEVWTR